MNKNLKTSDVDIENVESSNVVYKDDFERFLLHTNEKQVLLMEKEVLMFLFEKGKTILFLGKFLCVLIFPRKIKLFFHYINVI